MNPIAESSSWLEIDRGAVAANLQQLTRLVGRPVMAVVKSNGYGHGMLEVARAAVGAGAHSLGLARLDEALQLRAEGVVAPMLAMGGIPAGRWPEAVAADVQAAVWTREHVEAAAAAARQVQRPARLHLKVDTGMTRLGGFPEQAYPVAGLITAADDVIFEGVFTHLARADEADHRPTLHQLNVFGGLIARLEADSMRPPLIHAANTAAAITVPESRFDLVRCGIGLFGLSPSPECPLPSEFVPALSWKSRLSLVRQVPPGTGVSYGHAYVTRGSERIGVVPVGYGDGYRRTEGNQVLVRGRRVPVVGRVCMDQLMVGLDDIPDAAAGEEVVLIGRQSVEAISAEELAAIWGTIPYEVVCGVTSRVPRVYV